MSTTAPTPLPVRARPARTPAVEVRGLTKTFGPVTAVDRLDLTVASGEVVAFLGPNGAGKSTTMKMLLSLIEPSDGEVQILGQSMTRATRRSLLGRIGSLIEAPPGYAHLTGAENMRLIQRLLHLDDAQIEHAVQVVHLTEQMNKKVREYSLGMKQRLGIAMALARQPQLLILDEPANGLDPEGIRWLNHFLRDYAAQGNAVVLCTHHLAEAEAISTATTMIRAGRTVYQGPTTDDLEHHYFTMMGKP
mgnify:CR=1 FL=1